MKILVIGSGAREHALIWKIAQSPLTTKIYAAPGNGGIRQLAECLPIKADDVKNLADWAEQNQIDLTIVGPEAPLVLGITDLFESKGLKIFGPNAKGAQLEGSKVFAKEFMMRHQVPTAKYKSFSKAEDALKSVHEFSLPLVVKADGLAAGKGVIICQLYDEAEAAIQEIMNDKKFGDAGNQIVLEEFLDGIEASLLCFVDGKHIVPMESARDYKKAMDNDEGLNTGGMGTFSPNPVFNPVLEKQIQNEVLNRTLDGLVKDNFNFKGIIFIGLMIKNNQSKVLEYNVRLGDPETEVVIPRLKSDLVTIILKTLDGNISQEDFEWSDQKCICAIAVSGGYPADFEKGKVIHGLETVDKDVFVFHGGTKYSDGKILTDGGRVLAVTSLGDSLHTAREKVYANIKKITFENMYYRTDIGNI